MGQAGGRAATQRVPLPWAHHGAHGYQHCSWEHTKRFAPAPRKIQWQHSTYPPRIIWGWRSSQIQKSFCSFLRLEGSSLNWWNANARNLFSIFIACPCLINSTYYSIKNLILISTPFKPKRVSPLSSVGMVSENKIVYYRCLMENIHMGRRHNVHQWPRRTITKIITLNLKEEGKMKWTLKLNVFALTW